MVKNKPPADHHFVPQFLLRNFVDAAGELHVYDRRTSQRGVFNNSPEKVFFESQLYTAYEKDLSKNVDLELAFANLEGVLAPVVDRIVQGARQGQDVAPHPGERQLLALYTYFQWKRVPDNFKQYASVGTIREDGEKALRKFEAEFGALNDQEREHFQKDETWRRMLQNVRRDVIARGNPAIVEAINNKRLCIVRTSNPAHAFIISSYPVYKLHHPGRANLDDPELEMWFPIASEVSLVWVGLGGDTLFKPLFDGVEIRKLNKAAAAKANMIASRSPQLTASLASCVGRQIESRGGPLPQSGGSPAG
ncbi:MULTISPECIES: DUF4238 domain-containing protein [unclassified Mesorhizobium]|uniref:DUF4238 domain-containing protein n=1 Tax=unclassified Mesorhizobium TaxID=325217 RepID=UPI00241506A8|nr:MULTISPECIES: DUF4238 domain-containing protein [unclassified Mesorhizobium]MDG4904552.1 DUF4238 domain-containing protein [Mesorhizobium sp. WSM4962]MDG4907684.1 DUF4238 domain-containing protein [Mesorhizobium sp. WSM4898]MDG4920306.1 DUF4238 domain-containing protein [Mesorhizobium sp. WSM4989]